jgi:Divergent InlB B-repeat domain
VTENGTGSGTVTSSPGGISCPTTCSAQYTKGTMVTLTPTPHSGSVFAGWSGGGCSGTGTCTVTMNADTSVTATFNTAPPGNHTLTVKEAGAGKGKVTDGTGAISCPSSCSHSYANGTHVTLHATAAKGSHFAGWSGGGCKGTGTCAVTMNADRTVTATFKKVSAPAAPAGLRITHVSSAALRTGCGTEQAVIAALTDSQCTAGKLTVTGTINPKATGKVHLKITFNLGHGQQTATGDAQIVSGHWKATLMVSGINHDPHPPTYTINAKFNGSKGVKPGHANKKVTLEVETSAGIGPGKP